MVRTVLLGAAISTPLASAQGPTGVPAGQAAGANVPASDAAMRAEVQRQFSTYLKSAQAQPPPVKTRPLWLDGLFLLGAFVLGGGIAWIVATVLRNKREAEIASRAKFAALGNSQGAFGTSIALTREGVQGLLQSHAESVDLKNGARHQQLVEDSGRTKEALGNISFEVRERGAEVRSMLEAVGTQLGVDRTNLQGAFRHLEAMIHGQDPSFEAIFASLAAIESRTLPLASRGSGDHAARFAEIATISRERGAQDPGSAAATFYDLLSQQAGYLASLATKHPVGSEPDPNDSGWNSLFGPGRLPALDRVPDGAILPAATVLREYLEARSALVAAFRERGIEAIVPRLGDSVDLARQLPEPSRNEPTNDPARHQTIARVDEFGLLDRRSGDRVLRPARVGLYVYSDAGSAEVSPTPAPVLTASSPLPPVTAPATVEAQSELVSERPRQEAPSVDGPPKFEETVVAPPIPPSDPPAATPDSRERV